MPAWNPANPPPWRKQLILLSNAVGTCCLVACVVSASAALFRRTAGGPAVDGLKAGVRGFGAAAIVSCLACHLVDPGAPPPDPDDPGPGPAVPDDDSSRARERRLPDGTAWCQKWCRECEVWRPHRCGHCRQCGQCVLRLDHHCGFMGACVGQHNCRFFSAFLFCAGMGVNCVLALGICHLVRLGCWERGALPSWPEEWEAFALVPFLLCCPPVPCLCFCTLGPTLSCGGVGYGGMMLADINTRQEMGPEHLAAKGRAKGRPAAKRVTLQDVAADVRRCLRCAGFRVYCCAPISLRRCAARNRVASSSSSSAAAEDEEDATRLVAYGRPQSDAESDER